MPFAAKPRRIMLGMMHIVCYKMLTVRALEHIVPIEARIVPSVRCDRFIFYHNFGVATLELIVYRVVCLG